MAPTGPKRVVPPRPPADLHERTLPIEAVASTWFRMSAHASGVFWSRQGAYRFDSPGAKWGVCYTAESISSSFLEIFGDKIRRSRRLNWSEIEKMVVWRLHVSPTLRAVSVTGETLPVIKATVQSFVSGYALSQAWGRALMDHPDDIDGLEYIARRCGRPCLALFGDDSRPKDHQKALRSEKLGALRTWKGLWPMLDRMQIRVHGLPATAPKGVWM